VRRVAPTLFASIDRAVALCARTLDFTREGPASLDLSRVDLHELAAEVGEECLAAQARADVEEPRHWDNRIPPNTVVEGDRAQLHRVFLNLGGNAFQAGAGTVHIAGRPRDGLLEIEVEDNGPGLSPRARERLFQPFSGSVRSGGTGLGLAIAKELLRAHGGDIVLAGSDARGTRFRITLPLRQPDRRAANRPGASPSAADSDAA
jgi:signal transduction histidine kinase